MPISAKEFFKDVKPEDIQVIGNEPEQIEQLQVDTPNFFERVWNKYKSSANNIISEVKDSASDMGSMENFWTNPKVAVRGLETGLRTAGEVAKATFAPITEAPGVQQATEKVVDTVAGVTNTLSGRDLKADIAGVAADYEQWKAQNPDTAKNLEAVVNIGSLLAANKTSMDIGKATERVGAQVVDKAGDAVTATGRATKGAGEVTYKSAITPNVKEAEQILAYEAKYPLSTRIKATIKGEKLPAPTTRASTAMEQGLSGTERMIGRQAKRASERVWKTEIEPSLKNSKAIVTKDEVFKPVTEMISKTTEPTRRKALQDAFAAIQDDYKDVTSWSLADAQKVKQGLAEFTPDKFFRGQPVTSEVRVLQAKMADAIRQKIYKSITDKNIRKSYIDYGKLAELEKVGVKAISEGGLKGGFGSFMSSMWDAATTPVKTIGGQVLYKVGDSIEFVGQKGIKKFGDYLKKKGFEKPVSMSERSPVAKLVKNTKPNLGLSTKDVSGTMTRDGLRDTVAKQLTAEIDDIHNMVNTGAANIEDWARLSNILNKIEKGKDTVDDLVYAQNKIKQLNTGFTTKSVGGAGKTLKETPKTVRAWIKSKFSDGGGYADLPVIRKEEGITLYQGGSNEGRQFWTPDKEYASQFGKVTKKTGTFYQVDNGNRMTKVYVEAPSKTLKGSVKSGGMKDPLLQEARKYKSADEFVKAVQNKSNISQQGKFQEIPLNKIKGTDYIELDDALRTNKKLTLDDALKIVTDNEEMAVSKSVTMPIEVVKNSDGTFSLMAGNHRVAQQLINGKPTIFANITNEKGFSTKSQLTDIWNKANKK